MDPTPTAISQVSMDFTGIYTNGQQLMLAMFATGEPSHELHMFVWALGGMIIGFFLLAFIASLVYRRWAR